MIAEINDHHNVLCSAVECHHRQNCSSSPSSSVIGTTRVSDVNCTTPGKCREIAVRCERLFDDGMPSSPDCSPIRVIARAQRNWLH